MLDVLVSVKDENGDLRFSADEITGIFISMMFAGHHTTSGTAAWSLIEMLRHPDTMTDVVDELDNLYSDGADISFHALRQLPVLEAVVKATLRQIGSASCGERVCQYVEISRVSGPSTKK